MVLTTALIAAAVAAGVTGTGAAVAGGVKMKDAKDTMDCAKRKFDRAQERVQNSQTAATSAMDDLGKLELEVEQSWQSFSDLIEKIQNRPQFNEISHNGITLPTFTPEELRKVSVGAGVLLGGAGGAAAGTLGGIAASGATTAAVMALGTASTGTAIASLSGAAATNATLAALGGGAIAAGGGGIALGTAVLGGATLGVGLLVGGAIFAFTGSKLSNQANEAYDQACEAERKAEQICNFLDDLTESAERYNSALCAVRQKHNELYARLDAIVNAPYFWKRKTNWQKFTDSEKRLTENLCMLVALEYEMCKVKLVLQSGNSNGTNTVNHTDIENALQKQQQLAANIA